ncbi:MAG: DinB family protein [Armatimonadota bacterium]
MDLRPHLARQLIAAIDMLRQSIERCPDAVWFAENGPRPVWRIAYHALFFADLYSQPSMATFAPWKHHQDDAMDLWETPDPKPVVPYERAALIEYCDDLRARIPSTLDGVDPAQSDSGFDWYAMPKIEHMLLNLRHLAVHVGQIQEHCYAAGVDLGWISSAALPTDV